MVTGPFKGWRTVNMSGELSDTPLQRAWGTPLGEMPFMHRLAFSNVNPQLPNNTELIETMNLELYDTAPWNDSSHHPPSFRNTFEGWEETGCRLHNTVHLW